MKIKPVNFIHSHGLDELLNRYAISAARHTKHPNLIQLRYNLINSPLSSQTVQQCRGIILDEANNWNVICFPYRKFFNYGEREAAPINWKTARVYEKLDGSIITMYYYKDAWHAATSSFPDASGIVWSHSLTFNKLFWNTWDKLGYQLPKRTDYCYMFELMTPYNRVVVPHHESNIVLHGVRDLTSMCELDPEPIADDNRWQCVKMASDFSSIHDVIEASKELDPLSQEGFVVRDANWHRVKIKNPEYVILAKIQDSASERNFIEMVRSGDEEYNVYIQHFPELLEDYKRIRARFNKLVSDAETLYAKHMHIENQKEFALKIKDHPLAFIAFGLRSGKMRNAREALARCSIKHLEQLVSGNT